MGTITQDRCAATALIAAAFGISEAPVALVTQASMCPLIGEPGPSATGKTRPRPVIET